MAFGGRGEIRTHERLATLPVFKTGALNHSATLPAKQDQALSDYPEQNALATLFAFGPSSDQSYLA